jgi:hypothetical protein
LIKDDNKDSSGFRHKTICLLARYLTRANRAQELKKHKKWRVVEMGRICVEIPDDLEKNLRFKAIEKFGGRKGDLSRAVEEAVKTWVTKEA